MIIEFDDKESYDEAQRILIQLHEEKPPPPSLYKPFHFIRDEEADEVIRRLNQARVPYTVVDGSNVSTRPPETLRVDPSS